jgi:toxin ParE1/3/4
MARLILSQYVEPELAAIWDYIAVDNIDAADRFLASAYKSFNDLAEMPGMGRIRNYTGARLRELRSFRVKDFGNYLIFYIPLPDGIEVFHILHGARDFDEFLGEK